MSEELLFEIRVAKRAVANLIADAKNAPYDRDYYRGQVAAFEYAAQLLATIEATAKTAPAVTH